MVNSFQQVSIGQVVTSNTPEDVLGIYGLGSCVAVIVYDPKAVVGGVLHALLPTQVNNESSVTNLPTKFVDQGILKLLKDVYALGAQKTRLRVYVCGGAKIISTTVYNNTLNIGQRNVDMARDVLKQNRFRIYAEAVGGNTGRTIRFYLEDGRITIKTLGHEIQTLTR